MWIRKLGRLSIQTSVERETVDFTFQRIEEFIVKQPSNVVPFVIDYVKIPSTDKEWRQEAIGSLRIMDSHLLLLGMVSMCILRKS